MYLYVQKEFRWVMALSKDSPFRRNGGYKYADGGSLLEWFTYRGSYFVGRKVIKVMYISNYETMHCSRI